MRPSLASYMEAAKQYCRSHAGSGLAILFIVTVLFPALLLAIFALRALQQERNRADQQIDERMERAADIVTAGLERRLNNWQKSVDEMPAGMIIDEKGIPEIVRQELLEPGGGVLAYRSLSGFHVYPPGRLLFWPGDDEPDAAAPAAFTPAEDCEFREKNYLKAIDVYARLSAANPKYRAELRQRIARCYRKAGMLERAMAAYSELASEMSTRIGGIPADLLARYEMFSIRTETGGAATTAAEALCLYRDLVRGRWHLDQFRYCSYSAELRSWLEAGHSSQEFLGLRVEEEKTLAISRAVDEFLHNPQKLLSSGSYLAFSRSDPFALLLISADRLTAAVLPGLASAVGDFDIRLGNHATEPPVASNREHPVAERHLESIGLPWRLLIQPRNPEALYADFRRRQSFYLFVVAISLALLVSGGYLTLRTVRREVAVARLKSDFISAVSHEFRSPLTGLRHAAELLRAGRVKSEERRLQYYEMICQESGRLARLVHNVLDFSRIEEGHKEFRFAPLRTEEWLRGLAAEFQAEIAAAGVEIKVVMPNRLPTVNADREALSCAVHNLLDNAVKYSAASKEVWLEAEAHGRELIIRVRDQGIGIAESEQKHIFEKFYRGPGVADTVRGAGLGLALASGIVRAHRGSIEVESKLGAGSTFTIRLRIADAALDSHYESKESGQGRD